MGGASLKAPAFAVIVKAAAAAKIISCFKRNKKSDYKTALFYRLILPIDHFVQRTRRLLQRVSER